MAPGAGECVGVGLMEICAEDATNGVPATTGTGSRERLADGPGGADATASTTPSSVDHADCAGQGAESVRSAWLAANPSSSSPRLSLRIPSDEALTLSAATTSASTISRTPAPNSSWANIWRKVSGDA